MMISEDKGGILCTSDIHIDNLLFSDINLLVFTGVFFPINLRPVSASVLEDQSSKIN